MQGFLTEEKISVIGKPLAYSQSPKPSLKSFVVNKEEELSQVVIQPSASSRPVLDLEKIERFDSTKIL